MRAERSVIGTRRSSCVCKLEGRLVQVVEHEAVMKIINNSRDRGQSDAASRSERGSEGTPYTEKY